MPTCKGDERRITEYQTEVSLRNCEIYATGMTHNDNGKLEYFRKKQ